MVDQVELRSELLELAEHCENADASDSMLDASIHEAVTGFEPRVGGVGWPAGALVVPTFPGWMRLPAYTASVDAAMTLMPRGWFLQGLSERNASGEHNWRWKAELWSPDTDANVRGIGRRTHADKCAPALALCAAALRARTPTTPERSDGE